MKNRYFPIETDIFDKRILPLIIQQQNRSGRPTKVSHYTFFCAILYVMRTGVSWRDLPPLFVAHGTQFTPDLRWSENGLFWTILRKLQQDKYIQLDIAWLDIAEKV